MPFVLFMTTFWGISWVWSYSILYWMGNEKDRTVCLRFIKMGAIVAVVSHLGWIYLQANWWGILILDAIFVIVSTSIALVVSGHVRQKFIELRRKSS